MTTRDDGRDWVPNTPTARALERAARGGEESRAMETSASGKKPSPKPYREIPLDPDAPGAPVCSGRKYIVADPDAPDAPLCKPRKYIIAPDTAPSSAAPSSAADSDARPAWATQLGDELAARFK